VGMTLRTGTVLFRNAGKCVKPGVKMFIYG
jgi:hypothetical protein